MELNFFASTFIKSHDPWGIIYGSCNEEYSGASPRGGKGGTAGTVGTCFPRGYKCARKPSIYMIIWTRSFFVQADLSRWRGDAQCGPGYGGTTRDKLGGRRCRAMNPVPHCTLLKKAIQRPRSPGLSFRAVAHAIRTVGPRCTRLCARLRALRSPIIIIVIEHVLVT